MTQSSEKSRSPSERPVIRSTSFETLGSGGTVRERQADIGALVLAVALHFWGGAGAATSLFDLSSFTNLVRANVTSRLEATVEVEPPEPEPEQAEEPEPDEEPEPEEALQAPEAPESETAVEPEAAPAAAEAGKVLTSEPDPEEPLDLTGEGFISGTGTRFSGGVTTNDGTSTKAVRNLAARGDGVQGAQGKTEGARGTAPPAVDKSRPAGLPPGANWNSCGFPPEADAEQINQARVRVVVVVGADGRPTSVNVLNDPGYGFGRIARNCAMRFTYPPGLDKFGNAAPRATRPFAITFTR
jgi:protein TonB